METILELKQRLGKLYDEARAIIEKCDTEKRSIAEDEETRYEEIMAQMDALKIDIARREKLEGFRGLDRPEPQWRTNGQNQNGREAGNGFEATADNIASIYFRYLRTGDEGAKSEIRAYNDTDMNVTTAADGEVVVPVGMVRDIVARRDEMALFPRMGVRRVPGKGTTVNYPIDNEPDVVFATVSEGGNVLRDAPALTEKAFTLVKKGKYIQLTWELLRDEDAMLMAFLTEWVGRGWAATHNTALVTEVLASGTAGLTLDGAAAIGIAEIPELVGKVLPEYQDGSQWLMHPTTKAYIEGLNSANTFTFAPNPGGNMPGSQTLWGYPVNQSSYATAYGAGNKSLTFGNFYFLGMREGTSLQTLRDPYTAAGTGGVKLWYWFDLVYGVLQAEAIQYATHPTA